MGFDANTGAGGTNNSGNVRDNDNWKATGFLNIYLPSNEGGRVKLGAIPLKTAKPREKELAEWLAGKDIPADVGEEQRDHMLLQRMTKLVGKIQIEYASTEPSEGKGFDLT